MSTTGCQNLRDYLARQRSHLQRAIDENKWYLSERHGRDVGLTIAKSDFLDNHLDRVTHDFRIHFCQTACEKRTACPVVDGIHRIPPVRNRR
jgi:hypothetical protein